MSAPIITTIDHLPGYQIESVLGVARGSTVRAKHIGRDITAALKNIVGGEIKGYTELLAEGREEAIYRMLDDAKALNADAVIGFRFTTSMVSQAAVEIMAYGTAVKITATDA
jgi:uncharacterized protein YbjQ (UPF0145 family)